MKPISAIRRENLRLLVEAAGGQAELATRANKNKNQVYQWLQPDGSAHSRNISELTARELEKACGKPNGWMDHSHENSEPGPLSELRGRASQPTRLEPEIVARAFKWLRTAYSLNGRVFDPERDPDLFVYTYEYLTDQAGEEFDLLDFGKRLAEKQRIKDSRETIGGPQASSTGADDRREDERLRSRKA